MSLVAGTIPGHDIRVTFPLTTSSSLYCYGLPRVAFDGLNFSIFVGLFSTEIVFQVSFDISMNL